jgi:hypothetical protein
MYIGLGASDTLHKKPCLMDWGDAGSRIRTSMRRHCLSSRRGGLDGGRRSSCSPLRYASIRTSEEPHSLRWLCASDEIRLDSGYQGAAIFRAVSPHARGWTEFACAVALSRSEALSRATAVAPRHAPAVLASSPLCQDHLPFVHSPRSFALCFSKPPPPGPRSSGGRCAAARRPLRSSINCVVAQRAS